MFLIFAYSGYLQVLIVRDLNENVPKISTRRLAINTEFLVAL
jgi:hypothetical protein